MYIFWCSIISCHRRTNNSLIHFNEVLALLIFKLFNGQPFHLLISRSRPASATRWRYIVLTLYLTTATTLRTWKLSILSTIITATSCTKFSLRCKKWMKNERKEVIWPTPTLSQDGYLMAFRPKLFTNQIKRVECSSRVCLFVCLFVCLLESFLSNLRRKQSPVLASFTVQMCESSNIIVIGVVEKCWKPFEIVICV